MLSQGFCDNNMLWQQGLNLSKKTLDYVIRARWQITYEFIFRNVHKATLFWCQFDDSYLNTHTPEHLQSGIMD